MEALPGWLALAIGLMVCIGAFVVSTTARRDPNDDLPIADPYVALRRITSPEAPTMGSETKLDARVVRDEPGVTEIHVENRHVLRDGPMLVECWFSEEDGAYIAQLTDDEPEGRPFSATHTGIGATREEALAHLAVGEYVLALAVATPTPAADGEHVERVRSALKQVFDAANVSARPLTLNDLAEVLGMREYSHIGLADAILTLRARPLPDDVRAVVERVRRNLCGDHSDFECTFGDHVVETRDLRTLLAHLQREAPDAGA